MRSRVTRRECLSLAQRAHVLAVPSDPSWSIHRCQASSQLEAARRISYACRPHHCCRSRIAGANNSPFCKSIDSTIRLPPSHPPEPQEITKNQGRTSYVRFRKHSLSPQILCSKSIRACALPPSRAQRFTMRIALYPPVSCLPTSLLVLCIPSRMLWSCSASRQVFLMFIRRSVLLSQRLFERRGLLLRRGE